MFSLYANSCSSKTKVFVGNLPFEVEEKDLLELFYKYNPVHVYIAKNKQNGKGLGYGFVEFESEELTNKAMEDLNGIIYWGRSIKVAPANK
jgi:RNA recognition motif-containing protein